MATQNPVPKLYRTVVEDVVNNVREAFLDEGLDEQVLQELKQLWESKLLQSKAVESIPPEHEQFLAAQPAYTTIQQQQAQQQPTQPQAQPQAQNVQHVLTQQANAAYKTQNIEIPQSAVMPTVFAPVGGAIDLSNAAQTATLALPAGLYSQQIALNPGGITLQQTSQGHLIAVPNAAQSTQIAANQPQTHVTYTLAPTQINQAQQPTQPVIQLDGTNDTSSEEEEYDDEEDDKDDDDDDDAQKDENEEDQGEEEDPLNSGDDVSEEDPTEIFDTENVVVCQYDKINRNKNRWKFHLKDGIMNLNGRDYVFQKAIGDAEW